MKIYKKMLILTCMSAFLTACSFSGEKGSGNAQATQDSSSSENSSQASGSLDDAAAQKNENSISHGITIDDIFSNRDLSGEYDAGESISIELSDSNISASSDTVTVDGGDITLAQEGTYIFSGSINNGRIIVDAGKSDKIQLVLNNASVTSQSSAAIYVKKADKVFVTLAEDTQNTLSNGGTFNSEGDDKIDAVIFSKDDLTLNGAGTLSIASPAGHGVESKDELRIAGGTYSLETASHGLSANDELSITGSDISINAGKEGIEGTMVNIFDGNIDITAANDGINAANKNSSEINDVSINIMGGNITIDAQGDGIDANGNITVSGGNMIIMGPSDNENAPIDYDLSATISGGVVAAFGYSGEAQNFGEASSQGSILVKLDNQPNGALVQLIDSSGNALIESRTDKAFNCVVLSCPYIKAGETYTIKAGEYETQVDMTSLIYGSGYKH